MSHRGMGGCAFQAPGTPEERQEEERSAFQHELGRSIALRNQDSRLRLAIQPKAPSSPRLVTSSVTRHRRQSWVQIPPLANPVASCKSSPFSEPCFLTSK